MTAPTTPTLEEVIERFSDRAACPLAGPGWTLNDAGLQEREFDRFVLASLRRLATTEAELARKDAALEPFAEAAEEWVDEPGTETVGDEQAVWPTFRVGDFRRAREALGAKP